MDIIQLKADRELAKRIAGGNDQAFEEFFEEYFPRLFRFVLVRTDGDSHMAEEIVQNTMCKVIQKIESFRGQALLFTWLCQICRNELADTLRKRGARPQASVPFEDIPEVRSALESIISDPGSPETHRAAEELTRFVRVTLAHLPLKYATALEMKYVRGHSVDEIAGHLSMTAKAAESLLTRARSAFREGFRSLWDVEPEHLLR